MYTLELLMSLRRRWYLALLALLLAGGASFGIYQRTGAIYETEASFVLVPPRNTEFPGTNRYLMLDDLGQATGVVIRALNGDETHRAVARDAGGATYEVTPDYTTNAPILVISVKGPTAEDARGLLERVQSQVPSVLERLQTTIGVSESAQITSVPVTAERAPEPNAKNKLRAAVGLGVALLVLFMLSIGGLDGYLLRRAARPSLEPVTSDKLDAKREKKRAVS
jgi:hypothetical protein